MKLKTIFLNIGKTGAKTGKGKIANKSGN